MTAVVDVEAEGFVCPRLFYNFLSAVDGAGVRDQAFLLRAAGAFVANEVCTFMHIGFCDLPYPFVADDVRA